MPKASSRPKPRKIKDVDHPEPEGLLSAVEVRNIRDEAAITRKYEWRVDDHGRRLRFITPDQPRQIKRAITEMEITFWGKYLQGFCVDGPKTIEKLCEKIAYLELKLRDNRFHGEDRKLVREAAGEQARKHKEKLDKERAISEGHRLKAEALQKELDALRETPDA